MNLAKIWGYGFIVSLLALGLGKILAFQLVWNPPTWFVVSVVDLEKFFLKTYALEGVIVWLGGTVLLALSELTARKVALVVNRRR